MKFAYEAFDPSGRSVTGAVEATDVAEATESLRRQGLYVTNVRAASSGRDAPGTGGGGGAGSRSGKRRRMGSGKRMKNLAMFTRQLSVLVSSGTPLVQALGSLERQATEPRWKECVSTVRMKVEEGATLAQAMEACPDVFDAVCRSLIAAGESSGSFDTMLDRLSTMTRKQLQTRSAIVGAMVYPCLLIVIAINVLALMLLFVLPRFTILFSTLDVPLPPTTKFLMNLSTGLRNYWWAGLIGIGASAVAIRFWVTSPIGRRAIDTAAVRLPMLGKVMRSFSIARVLRVLGVLVNGKVPLLDALALARQSGRNCHFIEMIQRAEDAVTRGGNVSTVFEESKLVDPSLVEAIRSGEQSGQIGPLMLNIADFLDEENEVIVKSLTSILEPMILMVLGVVVGFIAISMFLPLFDLTAMTQQGGAG